MWLLPGFRETWLHSVPCSFQIHIRASSSAGRNCNLSTETVSHCFHFELCGFLELRSWMVVITILHYVSFCFFEGLPSSVVHSFMHLVRMLVTLVVSPLQGDGWGFLDTYSFRELQPVEEFLHCALYSVTYSLFQDFEDVFFFFFKVIITKFKDHLDSVG